MNKLKILVIGLTLMFLACPGPPYIVRYQSNIKVSEPIPYKTRIVVNLPKDLPKGIDEKSLIKAVTDDLTQNVFPNRVYADPEIITVVNILKLTYREKNWWKLIAIPAQLFGVFSIVWGLATDLSPLVFSPSLLIPWPYARLNAEVMVELDIRFTDGKSLKRYQESSKSSGTALSFYSGKQYHISSDGGVIKNALKKAMERIKQNIELDRLEIIAAIESERKPPEEIRKPSQVTKSPKLTFNYSLIDENQDKILDGGEKISLKVNVRNQGEGNAKGVKVLLSGESKVLNYLGREKFIGDIPSGTEKIAVFEAVLPYKIEPDNANLIIRVTEAQGFDALKECELLIAMQPAKVEREREIISTLVDVDQPLKPTSFRRENAYAIVIGISDYRSPKIPKVKYAKRDAETVKDYLTNICGIPSENIVCLTNEKATGTDLIAYIEEWLQRNVNKNSFVFIYFAGHGTPNPEKGDAYLVPYDGEPGFISKLYPLSRFYNSLENLPTENIVVALDACFSGAGGRSVIEEGKRPLINVKIEKVGKKAAVLTASASDEISQDLDSKRHGLFTYYILKGLRGEADLNNDGWITLGELYNYCQPKVKEESRRLGYTQTPKVFPEPLGEKANIRIGKVR